MSEAREAAAAGTETHWAWIRAALLSSIKAVMNSGNLVLLDSASNLVSVA